MLAKKTKSYQSYLVRCWQLQETGPDEPLVQRFVVEAVSSQPHRWGFDTFAELVAFLQAELVKERRPDETRDQASP